MGILKNALNEIKQDLGLIKKKPTYKWVEVTSERIIYNDDPIKINTPRRHPNYYKVKYLIMDCVVCGYDCMISSRQAEEVIGIGRSSINRQLKVLCDDGLLQKVKLSNSNRGIYYKILVDKDDAIQYKDTFTRAGRKKNKNIKSMSQ